jgi:hypothetical protein
MGLRSRQGSFTVSFLINCDLPETTMKERHPKFLKVKHPKEYCALLEAYLFVEVIP